MGLVFLIRPMDLLVIFLMFEVLFQKQFVSFFFNYFKSIFYSHAYLLQEMERLPQVFMLCVRQIIKLVHKVVLI